MKLLPNIVGGLLGLAFIAFGLMFLLNMMPQQPPPPEGSFIALYMGAMVPSGYLKFVKIMEVVGGLLVAIPKTRNMGLLVLGPIIINIMAFHAFIGKGEHFFDPPHVVICALAAYLLWVGRKAFGGLLN